MAKNKTFNVGSLIFPAIVLGITVYFLVACINGLDQTYVEEGWQEAPGVILAQDMELPGKDNARRKAEGVEQMINYEYTVGGVSYRSNSVSPNVTVDPTDYPQGKAVTVYYNPADVNRSVLARTEVAKLSLYVMILLCGCIIGVIVYYLQRDLRQRKEK